MKITPNIDETLIKSIDFDEAMVASAAVAASEVAPDTTLYTFDKKAGQYFDTEGNTPVVAAILASAVESSGARFIIPVAVPTEISSGDERSFKKNSITTRNLPLPLMWQIKTGSGHEGSVVVGRIDSIETSEDGLSNARGVFDIGPFGREAERMVRGGFLRGVSVDLDKFEAQVEDEEVDNEKFETKDDALDAAKKAKNSIKNEKILVESARLMGITIVPKPAFQECFIMIEEEPTLEVEEAPLLEGIYEETPEDFEYQLAALAASAAPVVPPKSWFKDPGLKRATPLTITDDGKVFGHIASWQTSHIGMGRGVKPPRSASQYAYFRTGELRTDEGDIQVGQLTLAGGHASLQASADEAIKHYDDTASAVADVVAGEDQFGIWVAGALRPDVTPSQIRAFRASSPSGDWRPINGRLELVAVCQVNVPGFPIARAITASGGVPGALVAAGAAYLAELREADKFAELDRRLNAIEKTTLSADIESARSRMSALMTQRNAELSAKADAARARMMSVKQSEDAELQAKLAQLRAKFNS